MNGLKEVKIINPTLGVNADRKIRMAAYCRVSTDSEDQINSFMAQMRYYNEYIREHDNMVFVDIYADEGITGTCIHKRDEFKRMMKDCKNRKIDRIIVKSVQRFARNSLECIESVRFFTECGVSVYFENDNIDTKSMNSEMLLYIKSAFAQGESLSASKRMSTSYRMRMENGTFVTTTAPYGYRLVNNQLEVCPEEAEIVKRIFELYLSGKGMNSIVAYFKQSGQYEDLKVSHIKYILSNEKYIGDTLMQKRYTPGVLPLKKKRNKGERAQYYSEGTHDAIISKDDFERVQMLRKERDDHFMKHSPAEKLFLDGKVRCRVCGRLFKKRKCENGVIWLCPHKGSTEVDCKSKVYSTEEIYMSFIRMYNRLKRNERVILDETIAQFHNLKKRITLGNVQVSEIDAEISNLCEQNAIYSKLHTKGIIDDVSYFEKTDSVKKQTEELRVRRNKLLSEDEEERCIEGLRQLKRVLNSTPNSISEFDTELFTSIVTKIYVEQNGDLSFCLIGELELRIEVK